MKGNTVDPQVLIDGPNEELGLINIQCPSVNGQLPIQDFPASGKLRIFKVCQKPGNPGLGANKAK